MNSLFLVIQSKNPDLFNKLCELQGNTNSLQIFYFVHLKNEILKPWGVNEPNLLTFGNLFVHDDQTEKLCEELPEHQSPDSSISKIIGIIRPVEKQKQSGISNQNKNVVAESPGICN